MKFGQIFHAPPLMVYMGHSVPQGYPTALDMHARLVDHGSEHSRPSYLTVYNNRKSDGGRTVLKML